MLVHLHLIQNNFRMLSQFLSDFVVIGVLVLFFVDFSELHFWKIRISSTIRLVWIIYLFIPCGHELRLSHSADVNLIAWSLIEIGIIVDIDLLVQQVIQFFSGVVKKRKLVQPLVFHAHIAFYKLNVTLFIVIINFFWIKRQFHTLNDIFPVGKRVVK
jgi:hypothetical protein